MRRHLDHHFKLQEHDHDCDDEVCSGKKDHLESKRLEEEEKYDDLPCWFNVSAELEIDYESKYYESLLQTAAAATSTNERHQHEEQERGGGIQDDEFHDEMYQNDHEDDDDDDDDDDGEKPAAAPAASIILAVCNADEEKHFKGKRRNHETRMNTTILGLKSPRIFNTILLQVAQVAAFCFKKARSKRHLRRVLSIMAHGLFFRGHFYEAFKMFRSEAEEYNSERWAKLLHITQLKQSVLLMAKRYSQTEKEMLIKKKKNNNNKNKKKKKGRVQLKEMNVLLQTLHKDSDFIRNQLNDNNKEYDDDDDDDKEGGDNLAAVADDHKNNGVEAAAAAGGGTMPPPSPAAPYLHVFVDKKAGGRGGGGGGGGTFTKIGGQLEHNPLLSKA
eukprot:jgi/Bigna1/135974/aug1.31_g10682